MARATTTPPAGARYALGSAGFATLHADADRLANGFVAAGLEAGDRLLLQCGNLPEFAEAMLDGERAGRGSMT